MPISAWLSTDVEGQGYTSEPARQNSVLQSSSSPSLGNLEMLIVQIYQALCILWNISEQFWKHFQYHLIKGVKILMSYIENHVLVNPEYSMDEICVSLQVTNIL